MTGSLLMKQAEKVHKRAVLTPLQRPPLALSGINSSNRGETIEKHDPIPSSGERPLPLCYFLWFHTKINFAKVKKIATSHRTFASDE